jgi:hypothetical protein
MRNYKIQFAYLITLLLYLATASISSAFMFVSFDRSYTLNGDAFDDPLAYAGISIGYYMFGGTSPIFDTITIRPENEGQTYRISSPLDDPDFDGFTALFTDGISESINFSIAWPEGGRSGEGFSESVLFSGLALDGVGYQIDEYAITVNNLSLDVPSNTYAFEYSFQAYGTPVPEPGTLGLLALGVLTLCVPVRKKDSITRKHNDESPTIITPTVAQGK